LPEFRQGVLRIIDVRFNFHAQRFAMATPREKRMKASTTTLFAAFLLVGCHADRSRETPSTVPAPSTSTAAVKADKSFEKSRDAMLGKNTSIDSQHWATDPAASSTSTTPAVAPGKAAPSGVSSASPAPTASPASSTIKTN
jgi:hypothetical protein